MSNDHKPTNKEETERIVAAGGFVEFGRVNGNLALSRAIGDFEFKQNFSLAPEKQIVTVNPEILTHKLDGEEEFFVLACDGIWDCLSSQQVIDFVRRAVANGDDLNRICEDLMVKCLATDSDTGGIGCDNMTVVIVAILGDRTPEEWKAWIRERVIHKVGRDTPESIPDVFRPSSGPPAAVGGLGALGGIGGIGGGFRVGGAGGLNIASILSASGIQIRTVDDSDDDAEELKIISGGDADDNEPTAYIDDKALADKVPKDISDALESAESSKSGSIKVIDEDGDSTMESGDESDSTTTGDAVPPSSSSAAPAPSFTSIGSPNVPSHQELLPLNSKIADDTAQKQLSSTPGGDEASGAVKVEGLMDTSENPTKM